MHYSFIDNDVEIRGQSCTHGPMRGNGQCPVKNIEEYPPANMAWGSYEYELGKWIEVGWFVL
ncbi:hypothetical protein T4D_1388 [Trichinella pseudospiralis]|uniref:Uncharacterized protein n=1 Tax=Trichinella pseudospiralis TaxID=6337 RepID=A0A0V1G4A2_TRIPS|nr:hypothetical protein T4D_1388 [Trichinella pseudospiralis]